MRKTGRSNDDGGRAARGRAAALVVVVVALVVGGCTRETSTASSSGSSTASSTASLRLDPCRLKGLETTVRCTTLEVPEDRDAGADSGGRRIPIRVAVIPALARQPEPDPVFVLAGGPGQSATEVAGQVQPLFAKLNRQRDIVFVDQRGTGGSHRLSCTEETASSSIAANFDAAATDRLIGACAARLGKDADLTRYTTDIAVRDLDEVRARLGYAKVNLWGASYGTRVALEYLRQFPDRVRTMTLDGVAPASMRLPLSFGIDTRAAAVELVASCRADAACAARYPRFERDLVGLLDRAGGPPVAVVHPVTGAKEDLRPTPVGLASLVRMPLYLGLTASLLPDAIDRAAHDDFGMLAAMSFTVGSGIEDSIALGMHLSVICSEDMQTIGEADLAAARERAANEPLGGRPNPFALVFVDQYRRFCAQWPTRRPPDAYFASLRGRPGADVPALLLSGGIDPATPPRHANDVAAALPHARAVVAPNVGHGVSLQGCAPDLVDRFVRSADAASLDVACLATIPRPPFLQPVQSVRHDGDAGAVP